MKKEDQKLLNDIFLQPWFVPRKTALAIRRILPRQYWHKMRFYFEEYGCVKCGKKKGRYNANGLCWPCGRLLKWRMSVVLKHRWKNLRVEDEAPSVMRILTAKQMLEDLIREKPTHRKRH